MAFRPQWRLLWVGIRGEPLGLHVEAAFGTVKHGLGCSDFVVGSRRCRLNIDNHRMLEVNEIIETVAE